MFISVLELFKIGIGPSSSHTMGPMIAALDFIGRCKAGELTGALKPNAQRLQIRCVLKGSLAFTGKGHHTDRAVALGLHGYTPERLAALPVEKLLKEIWQTTSIKLPQDQSISFSPREDIIFDTSDTLPEHPNGMIFELVDGSGSLILSATYFSIGGGFINTLAEIKQLVAPLKMKSVPTRAFPFSSADEMLQMSSASGLSVADMKQQNECEHISLEKLNQGLDAIWDSMCACIENGLAAEGVLPGGLNVSRRAKTLYHQLSTHPEQANLNDWLCAYAMAVNEENAAGHMVVTAPTNGAAGVIPAVLYHYVRHENKNPDKVYENSRVYLLTAAAIGGLIKHKSSISGAEVGCQGEVGSAAAMAAAGLCAVRGGTTEQIEHAAEIALEHHLGMTCDPVQGLVQVPCIERNGFGAIKAYTAASLALRGAGKHIMSLDSCIEAMKQTGLDMSEKYKETSRGGLAVSFTEC